MPGRATTKVKTAPRTKSASVTTMKRPEPRLRENEQVAQSQSPTAVQPVEPEDAYLTGVSRSLQRRLLGLNVQGKAGQAKPHPEATAAGLHATGSFAEAKGTKVKSAAVVKKK